MLVVHVELATYTNFIHSHRFPWERPTWRLVYLFFKAQPEIQLSYSELILSSSATWHILLVLIIIFSLSSSKAVERQALSSALWGQPQDPSERHRAATRKAHAASSEKLLHRERSWALQHAPQGGAHGPQGLLGQGSHKYTLWAPPARTHDLDYTILEGPFTRTIYHGSTLLLASWHIHSFLHSLLPTRTNKRLHAMTEERAPCPSTASQITKSKTKGKDRPPKNKTNTTSNTSTAPQTMQCPLCTHFKMDLMSYHPSRSSRNAYIQDFMARDTAGLSHKLKGSATWSSMSSPTSMTPWCLGVLSFAGHATTNSRPILKKKNKQPQTQTQDTGDPTKDKAQTPLGSSIQTDTLSTGTQGTPLPQQFLPTARHSNQADHNTPHSGNTSKPAMNNWAERKNGTHGQKKTKKKKPKPHTRPWHRESAPRKEEHSWPTLNYSPSRPKGKHYEKHIRSTAAPAPSPQDFHIPHTNTKDRLTTTSSSKKQKQNKTPKKKPRTSKTCPRLGGNSPTHFPTHQTTNNLGSVHRRLDWAKDSW